VAILWNFGTIRPQIACTVCRAVHVRWTLRRNRHQCLPSVGNKWAMVVPVVSTAWAKIVQPDTELAE